MRIFNIVLNNFANDSRVLKISKSLSAAGHEVTVVALHDGRSDLPQRESMHGFQVRRVLLKSKTWSRWKPVQFIKYFEFVLTASRLCADADILHCNDLNALFVGVVCRIRSRGRVRVVYDAHEHESERNGFSPAARVATRWFERMLISVPDRVITVTPSIADDYVRLYGIRTPDIIYNAPHYVEKKERNLLRSLCGIRPDQRIFVYQGALIRGRGIDILLDTFASLDERYCLVVIGGGVLASRVQSYAERHRNIFYVPAVDPLKLWEYTFSADYGIALIENTCKSYYMCLPNKLFEFMMAELPVIVSDMLELERFVAQYEVGVVSRVSQYALRDSIEAIAAADREQYVEKIRQVKRKYTWQEQELTLLALYEDVARLSDSVQPGRSRDAAGQ